MKRKTLDVFWEILIKKKKETNHQPVLWQDFKFSLVSHVETVWKFRSQVSLTPAPFYCHHVHLKHITGFWQKLRKWVRPTSQMFSDVCSLNCVRSEGVKPGPALRRPAKFPSSLMGNSVTCLAPKQETKPMRTDGAKRHMARLPLTPNRPSTTVLIGQSADERRVPHFTGSDPTFTDLLASDPSDWKQSKEQRKAPPSQTHLSHASVGVSHLDNHGERRGRHLETKTTSLYAAWPSPLLFLSAAFHVYTKTGGVCPSGD